MDNKIEIKSFQLSKNVGLGIARSIAVQKTKCDIVGVMDSDDIAIQTRFEKELSALIDLDVDLVGGQIAEFSNNENDIYAYRNVPLKNEDIICELFSRCPFNHPTVIFNKNSYYKSGGYLHWIYNEDYYLWIRMYEANLKFANVPDICLNFRAPISSIKRRRGKKYYKSEKEIQKLLLEKKYISKMKYLMNLLKRFIGQKIIGFLFPPLYFRLAHSKKNQYANQTYPTNNSVFNVDYSVVMNVYKNDVPEYFEAAIQSVLNQSVKPKEIIIIIDGEISKELRNAILKYATFETIDESELLIK